jgi:hypothetical protein
MLSSALGVAIGIIFIFMLFSLFLSTALEAVAALLKLRGRALRVAIARLIDDPQHKPIFGGFGLFDDVLRRIRGRRASTDVNARLAVAKALDRGNSEAHEGPTQAVQGDYAPLTRLRFNDVFCHPLVAGAQGKNRPSYVSPENFASALLYALRGDPVDTFVSDIERGISTLPRGPVRDALVTVAQEAAGDLEKIKAGVERWYDHAMDRLSGEYKRFSQAATFLIGLLLAASFDIDAIAITQRVYADPILRDAIVAHATSYIEQENAAQIAAPQVAEEKQKSRVKDGTGKGMASTIDTVRTPAEDDFAAKLEALKTARDKLLSATVMGSNSPTLWGYPILGWLITALAGMLGGPFWFELLQKLVNLRGTGPKPAAVTTKTGDVR